MQQESSFSSKSSIKNHSRYEMQTEIQKSVRVLGIDPFARGVGYAVIEGPNSLVDWGVKSTMRADNQKSMRIVKALIARFKPEVLAIEDCQSTGSRRCARVQKLLDGIAAGGEGQVRVCPVSHTQLSLIGPHAQTNTKYSRACYLAERFPDLRAFVPPFRKAWMTESDHMAIFDALSFAVASFRNSPRTPNGHER
jgi:hypothetical protein